MRKRSVALAAIALVATAMAFYVQLFERGPSLEEEERLAAARQKEDALAESRLKAEILARHRMEEVREQPGDGPVPNAVLRRSESGRGSALQQVRDSQDEQRAALARLQESLDTLELQMARSDRALRRDLEQLRAEVRREQDASGKVRILLLVALIPLVIHCLISVWPGRWNY
jgi:multidrug efflux pump subunit AcrA (membrane-fusion protein)